MSKLTNELIQELARDTSKIVRVHRGPTLTLIATETGFKFLVLGNEKPYQACTWCEILTNESIQESLKTLRDLKDRG